MLTLAPAAAPRVVHAQEASTAATKGKAAPTVVPPDDRPLSRYIPGEKLTLLVEHDGLDNHADAWAATATAKMLGETQLGAMLEALTAQLAERWLASAPNRKLNGADVVSIIKHAARRGVVVGGGVATGDGKGHTVVVFRGGAGKEARAPFSRMVGTFMGATKPQLVKKGSRTVVVVPAAEKTGTTWSWWSEGDDLVIETGDAAVVGDVIDGKIKSAVDHPVRQALTKANGSFQPVGRIFFDPQSLPGTGLAGSPLALLKGVGLQRVEWRYGVDNEAISSIVKLVAPKPRKGVMALFDQPTFDVSKLPPLPEGLGSFVAVSIDADKAVEALLANLPEGAGKDAIDQQVSTLKSKSRVDLKKDLLAHIGPRMVAYIMPGGPAARGGADGGLGGLTGLLGGAPLSPASLGALNGASVPRLTLVAEVDNAEAFGKSLDALMIAVNQQLRAQAAEMAEAAEAAAGAGGNAPAGAEGGEPRSRGGRGAGAAGRDRGRGASTAIPTPEFKLMPGKEKSYVLVVPSALSKSFPAGFRPAVRLGAKHVVIAATADAARMALEAKPGAWTPPSEISAAYDALPKNLMYLAVTDPRPVAPELLASLPATLQRAVNTAMVVSRTPSAGTGGPRAPGAPAADLSGGPGAPGGRKGNTLAGAPAGAYPGGGSGAPAGAYPGGGGGAPPGSGAPAGYPGSSGAGMPGAAAPGGGGGPGGGEGQADGAAAGGPLTFNIDPARMPKADDLRSRMFPATTNVTVDDSGVTIVQRESFPNVVGVVTALTGLLVGQSRTVGAMPAGAPGEGGQAPAGGGGLQPAVPGGGGGLQRAAPGGGGGLQPAVPGGGAPGGPPRGGNSPASPG